MPGARFRTVLDVISIDHAGQQRRSGSFAENANLQSAEIRKLFEQAADGGYRVIKTLPGKQTFSALAPQI